MVLRIDLESSDVALLSVVAGPLDDDDLATDEDQETQQIPGHRGDVGVELHSSDTARLVIVAAAATENLLATTTTEAQTQPSHAIVGIELQRSDVAALEALIVKTTELLSHMVHALHGSPSGAIDAPTTTDSQVQPSHGIGRVELERPDATLLS